MKKIRDGSVLLNPDKGLYKVSDGKTGFDKNRFEAVFNQKLKSNFKVDNKSEEEARKLFQMVRESRRRPQVSEPQSFGEPDVFIKKKDLKVFNTFLRDASDQKILANKMFSMLNRLEKAVPPSQPIRFSDFLNFICQPNQVKYNEKLLELNKNAKGEGSRYQLSQADVDQLWTADDSKRLAQVTANQK